MARYKPYCYAQGQLIPVMVSRQIQPGTFEFTLNHLIDHELDLSCFDSRFINDETGAPAFDPRILLKIILFAYSRGITSSRKIARAARRMSSSWPYPLGQFSQKRLFLQSRYVFKSYIAKIF